MPSKNRMDTSQRDPEAVRADRPHLTPFSLREGTLVVLGSLVFSIAFCYPMLCQIQYYGPGVWSWLKLAPDFSHLTRFPTQQNDWDVYVELRWVSWYTVTHFHQLPLWSPYRCGGMPQFGNPNASILTPFFLPALLLGPATALNAELILHLAVGFCGGYVLGRVLQFSTLAAIVCAAVFPASSWYYLRLAAGHFDYISAVYLPWISVFLYLSVDRERILYAALAGFFFALCVTEGDYLVSEVILLVSTLSVTLAAVKRSLFPIVAGIFTGIFGAAFAAPRLLSVIQLMQIHPRGGFGPDRNSVGLLLTSVFSRNQDLNRVFAVFGFQEYGSYISLAFAILAIVAFFGPRLNLVPWFASALVFFAMATGGQHSFSSSPILSHLPLSNDIRVPVRFMIGFVFCAGVVIAHGAEVLARLKPWGPSVLTALLVVALVDSWAVGPPNLRYMYYPPQRRQEPISREFRQVWSDSLSDMVMTTLTLANEGSVHCGGYGMFEVTTHVLGYNQDGYHGEYHLIGSGVARQSYWSPNLLKFHIDLPRTATLVVNQNFYPGWRVVAGRGEVYSEDGQLAVRMPPGRQEIELGFRPTYLFPSLIFSLLSAAVTVLLWWKR